MSNVARVPRQDANAVRMVPGSVIVDIAVAFRQTRTIVGVDTDAVRMATDLYDVSPVRVAAPSLVALLFLEASRVSNA